MMCWNRFGSVVVAVCEDGRLNKPSGKFVTADGSPFPTRSSDGKCDVTGSQLL